MKVKQKNFKLHKDIFDWIDIKAVEEAEPDRKRPEPSIIANRIFRAAMEADLAKAVKPDKAVSKRFIVPSQAEVANYFIEQGCTDWKKLSTRFIDHYESNGWKVGSNKMKCWKATIRGWISRNKENVKQVDKSERQGFIEKHSGTAWADGL